MITVKIITNNVPRDILEAHELTPAERAEVDYLDWSAIDAGTDSASFFRYRGNLYDLGEFTRDYGIATGAGLPDHLVVWDGYLSESAFSAVVVRYVRHEWGEIDPERVIVGMVLS